MNFIQNMITMFGIHIIDFIQKKQLKTIQLRSVQQEVSATGRFHLKRLFFLMKTFYQNHEPRFP